jgi:hypothetical protein
MNTTSKKSKIATATSASLTRGGRVMQRYGSFGAYPASIIDAAGRVHLTHLFKGQKWPRPGGGYPGRRPFKLYADILWKSNFCGYPPPAVAASTPAWDFRRCRRAIVKMVAKQTEIRL